MNLEEIKARCAAADVPALVTEVERLRADLTAASDAVFTEGIARIAADMEVERLRAALDAERKACDEWRRYAEMPDEDDDLFQYGEYLDALCVKHDARRLAEKGTT